MKAAHGAAFKFLVDLTGTFSNFLLEDLKSIALTIVL